MSEYIIIILTLLLQGFFSGVETAFVSCKKIRIRYKMEKGNPAARIVWALLSRPHRILATTLVGTNLSVVTGAIVATDLWGPAIATAVMVPVNLIFGEIVPKSISRIMANKILYVTAPALVFFQKILFPIVIFIEGFSGLVIRIFGVRHTKKDPLITQEDIELLVRQVASEGVIERSEQGAIHRIFDFRHTRVGDIMVRLRDAVSIDYNDDKKLIIEKAQKARFTRYPVLENKQIKGVLNIFDIFYNEPSPSMEGLCKGDWHKFIRPVRQVYANQRINQVLYEMQRNKDLISVVVRKGKFIGIITLEDIISEIELV